MRPEELARENHMFCVVTIPQRMFDPQFEEAVFAAAALAHEAHEYGNTVRLKEFRQYGWEDGYLGITGEAAEIWVRENIDPFRFASELNKAVRNGFTDRAEVRINEHLFVFEITDYETADDDQGFVRVDDPLKLPSGTRLDRRAIIRLEH